MELGDGFAFVGESACVQVGIQVLELNLRFDHRDSQYLVAFALKTGHLEPANLGK